MSAPKSAKKKPGDAVAFETHLAELESLVEQLERGDVPLADAVAAYETGLKTAQACEKLLADAQARLDELTGDDSDEENHSPESPA